MDNRFARIARTLALSLSVLALGLAGTASATSTVLGDGHIELYFTTPGVSAETALDTEADDAVIALIDSATSSLDICVYDFNHPGLVDAIVDAYERGISVRFVGHGQEVDQAGYLAVHDAGIPVSLRTKSGLMHNKFAIVDGTFVVTGSMNFSEAGVERNNNHVLIIDNADTADTYRAEFDQMFVDGNYGTSKTALPSAPVTLGGTTVSLAFSPKDNPELILRDALATADHSVYFMVFSFTRNDVAADLIAHHNSGVQVVGIYDKFGSSNRYATDEDLATAGIPVLLDGNENTVGSSGGKLHHKVMIIDAGTDSNPIVIAGSYNWSGNASDTNDENLVILEGSEAVDPFMAEFCEVFDAALPHDLTTGEIPDPCAAAPAVANALRINELLANPDGTDTPEEFVELVNTGNAAIDLTGWMIGDLTSDARHTFDSGLLAPGDAVVVYGGANAADPNRITASSGYLSLNNASETISLFDPAGTLVDSVSYTGAISGVSINRIDDGGATGAFDRHDAVSSSALAQSPGTRADSTAFVSSGDEGGDPGDDTPVPTEMSVTESGTLATGEWAHFGPFEATVDADFGALMTGTGDADLYVRVGAQPTTTEYDCRPFLYGSNETCDFTATETVSFYVSVHGYSASTFSVDIRHTVLVGGSDPAPSEANVVIVAMLPNPTGTDLGQEYVVLANTGDAAADLSDFTLSDAANLRHVFAPGTTLAAGETLVIFDRGDHGPSALLASTSSLSLNNGGDTITLGDAAGETVHSAVYSGSSEGQEVTLGTDF